MNLLWELIDQIKQHWEAVLWLVSLLSGAFGLFKRAGRKMLHETVLDQVRPIQEQMLAEVRSMATQFQNNGGSSMKDTIDRVDGKLDVVSTQLLALRTNTPAPYLEMDADLKHTFVNAAFRSLFGVRFEDALGDFDWQAAVHPDDRDRLAQERESLRRRPHEYIIPARIINQRDGKLFTTTSYGFPIRVHGKFIGYCATTIIEREEPLSPELRNRATNRSAEA